MIISRTHKTRFLCQSKWKVIEEQHEEIFLLFLILEKILNCAYLSEFDKNLVYKTLLTG